MACIRSNVRSRESRLCRREYPVKGGGDPGLEGEGPFRLIFPQASPGRPDRGFRFGPSGFDDGHDFDSELDHNVGLCARPVVAVRVNPLLSGREELDWKNGGFSLPEHASLIVYGHGITGD